MTRGYTDVPELRCCVAGCDRAWSCEFGFGKLCSFHDDERRENRRAEKRQAPIPDLPPVTRPWQDGKEAVDEPLPF